MRYRRLDPCPSTRGARWLSSPGRMAWWEDGQGIRRNESCQDLAGAPLLLLLLLPVCAVCRQWALGEWPLQHLRRCRRR